MFAICLLLEMPLRGFPFQMKSFEQSDVLFLNIMQSSENLVFEGNPLRGISSRRHIAKLLAEAGLRGTGSPGGAPARGNAGGNAATRSGAEYITVCRR